MAYRSLVLIKDGRTNYSCLPPAIFSVEAQTECNEYHQRQSRQWSVLPTNDIIVVLQRMLEVVN
jgi:hypothetical protein